MTPATITGLAIFLATYVLIATERIHKTIAAMVGGVAMILLGIVSQEQAFEEIDFNVIFLLAGMMILAAIIRKTGVFGWMAVRAARLAGGDPYRVLVILSLITAVASAFLDNVTTVVLVGPITLFLAARMGLRSLATASGRASCPSSPRMRVTSNSVFHGGMRSSGGPVTPSGGTQSSCIRTSTRSFFMPCTHSQTRRRPRCR